MTSNHDQSNNMSLNINEDITQAEAKDLDRKKKQAETFSRYLESTGISIAFQIILAEISQKNIEQEKVYSYTAMRLRQIGQDLQNLSVKI